ncbi:MAG: hypothetical protein ACOC9V_03680 [Chloroflexota bacterium]
METHRQEVNKAALIGGLLLGSFLLIFALIGFLTGTTASADSSAQDGGPSWDPVFTESFEDGIGSEWTVSDGNGTDNGEYYWATTDVTATQGITSVWATGGGEDGELLVPLQDNYPNNALSYMVRGPVDLSGTTRVRLSFDYWAQTAESLDAMQVLASTDGSTYTVQRTISGDSDGWQTEVIDLNDYAGEEEVWISFFFSSNAANTDLGVFLDNIALESLTDTDTYLPILRLDHTKTPTPTPTNTPTPTPPPYYYYDDFSDPESGWPIVDHTHDPQDCFEWYYENDEYKVNICDDFTDVKVSPLVPLPDGDYSMEADARFRWSGGWQHSYGLIFDGKDDPDPDNPDLGDYYMVWVLWEGEEGHRWQLLKDIPGDQIELTEWQLLSDDVYNYGSDGTAWNSWRIERTEDSIRVFVNDHFLREISEPRPRTNHQILFGVFAATYEFNQMEAAFDNVLIDYLDGSGPAWQGTPRPFYDYGSFDLAPALPKTEE